jgi:uncharacterized protein
MDFPTLVLLLGAGLVGGMANAMAGGASLITFPALMAAGLAPIPANTSNAVAVVFGNIMGAWAERGKIPPITNALLGSFAAAIVGGGLGGLLLLVTPENVFVLVVPLLIGAATLVFALARKIQSWVGTRFGANSDSLRTALLFPATVYGGYFGAGLGVILMAVLSATSTWDMRSTNAVKNLLGVLSNAAAIVVFVAQDIISWPETLVMMAGCIGGGLLGGKALAFISAQTMRIAITAIGTAMTLLYAWKFWL